MEQSTPEVRLTLVQPNTPATKFSLRTPTITVGRAHDCTIPIRDRFLSRHHAEIVWSGATWVVRDCGSANGTQLNGRKVDEEIQLHPGDRIMVGDSEIVFEAPHDDSTSQLRAVETFGQATNLSIPLQTALEEAVSRQPERTRILNDLALELIEDRSMDQVFDFILDRVMKLLDPSRVALALLGPDKRTFLTVRMKRHDSGDSAELVISRTLLAEVLGEKRVITFFDSNVDEKLQLAQSLIAQRIRSAICAPLIVGEEVLGVLYLDFRFDKGEISPEDVRLIAQIARFAAVKLENARLREEAIAKAKMDEELRTAYTIQKKLLPSVPPEVAGYSFAGKNQPCRTVSGDYFDYVMRPDGRMYFVIADVSGKGITAALVMTGLATAFNIFTRTDPTPGQLLSEINATLAPKTAPNKFATVFAGVLDPATGTIEFANAGHVPPLVISGSEVSMLKSTDMVVGLFPSATYRTQTLTLGPGDSLVLFTDGITEATDKNDCELGFDPVVSAVKTMHRADAESVVQVVEETVSNFVGDATMIDDATLLVISRCGEQP
jgi:sigma-B regulation protein RsbU (phosphoserine phosphatase)